ncbi:MAG: PAS domain-containing protein, partial [Nanoarchaeota archaeon]
MQQNKEGEDSSGARPDGLPDCRVLDLMPSAVVVVDQEGGILRMNSCFCEVFGYATRTLRQKGLAGLIDAESVQECLHQQQYSGFARGVRARRKDVVFVVRSRRVSTQKGSYVVVDIQEQNDEYRVVFDDSPDAMFVHDLKGNFLDVNEMACRRLGYSRSELLQMGPKQIDAPGYVENYSDLISELKK